MELWRLLMLSGHCWLPYRGRLSAKVSDVVLEQVESSFGMTLGAYPAVDGLLVLGLKLPHTSVLSWNHPLAEIASGHVILEMNSKTDPPQELQQEQAWAANKVTALKSIARSKNGQHS